VKFLAGNEVERGCFPIYVLFPIERLTEPKVHLARSEADYVIMSFCNDDLCNDFGRDDQCGGSGRLAILNVTFLLPACLVLMCFFSRQ
jgi:hypothetical protein